jgi:hypothetical protein
MFCAYVGVLYYARDKHKMTYSAGSVYLKITAACKLLHLHEEAFRWLFNENYTSLYNKILFIYPDGRKFVTFHIFFLLIEENTQIYYSIWQRWNAVFCVSANKTKKKRPYTGREPDGSSGHMVEFFGRENGFSPFLKHIWQDNKKTRTYMSVAGFEPLIPVLV